MVFLWHFYGIFVEHIDIWWWRVDWNVFFSMTQRNFTDFWLAEQFFRAIASKKLPEMRFLRHFMSFYSHLQHFDAAKWQSQVEKPWYVFLISLTIVFLAGFMLILRYVWVLHPKNAKKCHFDGILRHVMSLKVVYFTWIFAWVCLSV